MGQSYGLYSFHERIIFDITTLRTLLKPVKTEKASGSGSTAPSTKGKGAPSTKGKAKKGKAAKAKAKPKTRGTRARADAKSPGGDAEEGNEPCGRAKKLRKRS